MGVVTTAQELAWNTTISEIKMHQEIIVPEDCIGIFTIVILPNVIWSQFQLKIIPT
jgi:hypothetical protein